jgi:predicted transcriptional regulator
MTKQEMNNRNKAILLTAIYEPELTMEAVGDRYGITKQRVSQILKEQDVDHGVVRLRQRNKEDAYRESLKGTTVKVMTILPNKKPKPEYSVYVNMLRRCLTPKCPSYKNYGG